MGKLEPLVKWSGSKRSQAKSIVDRITRERRHYGTYIEPFCGGCSVLYYILNTCPGYFDAFLCNDINAPLVHIYTAVKRDPASLASTYRTLWKELNKDDNIERKKSFFADVRDGFNKNHRPELLFFIMRTTTNGMPRYNRNGDFNNSFHVTRNGMHPDRMSAVIDAWSELLNRYNVNFSTGSYNRVQPGPTDLMYLDPPYAHTKGMYYGSIDCDALYSYLRRIPCDYCMSFDGEVDGEDYFVCVPDDIYTERYLLDSGVSSFRRIIGNGKIVNVKESLYCRFRTE